ncbi:hypothetical protein V8E36_007994 [Tilletia maclaganii]
MVTRDKALEWLSGPIGGSGPSFDWIQHQLDAVITEARRVEQRQLREQYEREQQRERERGQQLREQQHAPVASSSRLVDHGGDEAGGGLGMGPGEGLFPSSDPDGTESEYSIPRDKLGDDSTQDEELPASEPDAAPGPSKSSARHPFPRTQTQTVSSEYSRTRSQLPSSRSVPDGHRGAGLPSAMTRGLIQETQDLTDPSLSPSRAGSGSTDRRPISIPPTTSARASHEQQGTTSTARQRTVKFDMPPTLIRGVPERSGFSALTAVTTPADTAQIASRERTFSRSRSIPTRSSDALSALYDSSADSMSFLPSKGKGKARQMDEDPVPPMMMHSTPAVARIQHAKSKSGSTVNLEHLASENEAAAATASSSGPSSPSTVRAATKRKALSETGGQSPGSKQRNDKTANLTSDRSTSTRISPLARSRPFDRSISAGGATSGLGLGLSTSTSTIPSTRSAKITAQLRRSRMLGSEGEVVGWDDEETQLQDGSAGGGGGAGRSAAAPREERTRLPAPARSAAPARATSSRAPEPAPQRIRATAASVESPERGASRRPVDLRHALIPAPLHNRQHARAPGPPPSKEGIGDDEEDLSEQERAIELLPATITERVERAKEIARKRKDRDVAAAKQRQEEERRERHHPRRDAAGLCKSLHGPGPGPGTRGSGHPAGPSVSREGLSSAQVEHAFAPGAGLKRPPLEFSTQKVARLPGHSFAQLPAPPSPPQDHDLPRKRRHREDAVRDDGAGIAGGISSGVNQQYVQVQHHIALLQQQLHEEHQQRQCLGPSLNSGGNAAVTGGQHHGGGGTSTKKRKLALADTSVRGSTGGGGGSVAQEHVAGGEQRPTLLPPAGRMVTLERARIRSATVKPPSTRGTGRGSRGGGRAAAKASSVAGHVGGTSAAAAATTAGEREREAAVQPPDGASVKARSKLAMEDGRARR